ncbi:hypothetical protein [Caloranaerobacter azorensis]|uniref:Uncharacterized protein n=1 Tax=Caloranaerobacter azorensis TaxID=116090 RepID=A0A6P1YFN7_9FIRM|nr:hypothetical protein [Caloranaerobacter azorensis]QIB28004.1 hypothetical protein G3A45_12405 [Caloranaerobacter azorensis]
MDKKIVYKDGKLIIESEEVIQSLKDQGLQFSDDGTLELEEGSNVYASIKWG